MPMRQRDRLLDQLRRAALHGSGEHCTDGQLLESFIVRRDEIAFEALLRRHGPMVRGVCLRVLGNSHDADDAFQAAFLVLVRRATSVRPREAVGNFLYGVAHRTALEVLKQRQRRRTREIALDHLPLPVHEPNDLGPEWRSILDREVSRLSDKYRLPVVLCELEGRSRKEVARQLAIPEGTLSSRLATARKRLAARLARYGLAVTAASLAALFAANTAPACVPAALASATTKTALLTAAGPAAGLVSTTVLTLTEGVLKTMFIAKIKTAAVVLCGVAALGLGTGGVLYQTRAGAADPQRVERGAPDRPKRGSEASPDWRQIAEEAQAREKKLQDEVQKLRAVLEDLKAQAQMQQKKAQEERQRAEAALQEARQMLMEMRDAKAARTPGNKPAPGQPNQAAANKTLNQDAERRKAMLAQIEQEGQRLLEQYKERFRLIEAQRQKLVEEQTNRELEQKTLKEKLAQELHRLDEMKQQLLQEQPANQPNPGANVPRTDGDKLDQILQRLERLEKRLDHLEKNRR